jgi:predicted transport protein
MNLGEINIVPRQQYIGFKRKRNVVDIGFQKGNLVVWINLKKGKLDDPKGMTRDISDSLGFGNGDYDIKIYPDSDLDYLMSLINQSYKNQD